MSTTIFVRELRLYGIHGAHACHSNTPREFTIDAEVLVSDTDAAISDSLADVFDYRHIVLCAREVVEGPSVQLIETLATRISARILTHPLAQNIKLTLWKRELENDSRSGITIVRSA